MAERYAESMNCPECKSDNFQREKSPLPHARTCCLDCGLELTSIEWDTRLWLSRKTELANVDNLSTEEISELAYINIRLKKLGF